MTTTTTTDTGEIDEATAASVLDWIDETRATMTRLVSIIHSKFPELADNGEEAGR